MNVNKQYLIFNCRYIGFLFLHHLLMNHVVYSYWTFHFYQAMCLSFISALILTYLKIYLLIANITSKLEGLTVPITAYSLQLQASCSLLHSYPLLNDSWPVNCDSYDLSLGFHAIDVSRLKRCKVWVVFAIARLHWVLLPVIICFFLSWPIVLCVNGWLGRIIITLITVVIRLFHESFDDEMYWKNLNTVRENSLTSVKADTVEHVFICPTDVDDCSPTPCKNGGTCVDFVNGFQCICDIGWEGQLCERGEWTLFN